MEQFDYFKSFTAHFPYETIRREQRAALVEVASGWDKHKKFAVLELPTGVGKSAIGMAIARAVADDGGRVYIVTPQKILQDQYAREFGGDLAVLKGKSTYQCTNDNYPGKTCANAPCVHKMEIKKSCPAACPYKEAVEDALNGDISLFNMDNFYFQTKFGKFKGKRRDVLIIDEGHKIEQKFMGFYSLRLEHGEMYGQIPEYGTVREYIPFLQIVLSKLLDAFNAATMLVDESEEIEELEREINKVDSVIKQIGHSEWVLNKLTHQEYGASVFDGIELKKLYVNDIIPAALFDYADRVVIMSATIIDHDQFCQNVGIDKSDAISVSCSSPFRKENRPVYFYDSGSMSMRNWERSKDRLIEDVKKILAKHGNERGIIHTYSNKIAVFIEKNIDDPRLIFKGALLNVNDSLARLEASDNGVLVGSGMEEGIDLKDDLSRFQILCKVPYPSLGDAQIKRRMELDPSYYQFLTILTIVQAYGRSVRNENDYAKTYILDSDYRRLSRARLPEWFAEAVRDEQKTLFDMGA